MGWSSRAISIPALATQKVYVHGPGSRHGGALAAVRFAQARCALCGTFPSAGAVHYSSAMTPVRTLLVSSGATDPAGITNLCATGMAEFDASLALHWLNPALAERLGGGTRRWQGLPLAAFDRGASGLVAAANRARDVQHVVVLRQARIADAADGEFVADLAFTPLAGRRVLLELHEVGTGATDASPALSESLRGFAHEVKNPLAGVRGAAQLLGRRVEQAELAELAELIIAETDRLTALADRLLRAGGKPRMAKLNVHELLERVAALIGAQAGAPDVRRDYDPSLPTTFGDADRLYQLLLNLARNAVEADARTLTLRTRIEFAARVSERLRRAALRIDVIDDGVGIPAEIATSLYQPLVSGRPDGSGLGLALAQEIAREHAGELRHSSRPGATSFTLLLPLDWPA